jgi:hypothetical protein
MAEVAVTASAGPATPAQVSEALERNPGSQRLRDRGWTPLWFEAQVTVDGTTGEHLHSVVWVEPGRAAADVAEEELEQALDEALRNLRDYEGLDVWPEDVADRTLHVSD